MDNAGYATLSRQSALLSELRMVANNIANASTTGFRREGVVFSEYVHQLEDGAPSLSVARPGVRALSEVQGKLTPTGGSLDFAIEGPGYFLVETATGQALTRNGAFTTSAEGELVTMDGLRVLDAGGAPIFVPGDAKISLSSDGTLAADGQPLAQVGVYEVARQQDMIRGSGTLFELAAGAAPQAVEAPVIMQNFLETSNVDPMTEMARLIEVQRAYEAGQEFLKSEDERMRAVISTVGQR
jgi:flagellar basal-body rod protein FlgF